MKSYHVASLNLILPKVKGIKFFSSSHMNTKQRRVHLNGCIPFKQKTKSHENPKQVQRKFATTYLESL